MMFFARIIGSFVDKVIFKNEEAVALPASWRPFRQLVLGFLASAIVMVLRANARFRADETGARLGTSAMIGTATPALRSRDYQYRTT